jgi:hypothetical protein
MRAVVAEILQISIRILQTSPVMSLNAVRRVAKGANPDF